MEQQRQHPPSSPSTSYDLFAVSSSSHAPEAHLQQPERDQAHLSDVVAPRRRATPIVPPGFDKPDPTPAEAAAAQVSRHKPTIKSRAGSVSAVTPAVPALTPARASTPLKREFIPEKSGEEDGCRPDVSTESSDPATAPPAPAMGKNPVDQKIRAVDQQAKEVRKPATDSIDGAKLALDPAARPSPKPTDVTAVPSGASKTAEQASVKAKAKASTPRKRQAPGKLDIAAAAKDTESDTEAVMGGSARDGPGVKSSQPPTAATSSRPATPAAPLTGSPVKRVVAPRTLRLVSTPKTETPPLTSAVAPPAVGMATAGPSRKGSIASINMPGTPSQDISDSVSITSTSLSMSRASSPPPAKKTKSQVMRERKEKAAAKLAATEEVALKKDEPVIAPILARKKKEKKAKDKGPVAAVKKEESRPGTPDIETASRADSDASAAVDTPAEQTQRGPQGAAADTEMAESPIADKVEEKKLVSAAAALRELSARGDLDIAGLEMLKANLGAISSHLRHDSRLRYDSHDFANTLKLPGRFDDSTEAKFAQHETVRWVEGPHPDKLSARNLVSPAGTWLKMLSAEEEGRYLRLEDRLRADSEADAMGLWQRPGMEEQLAQLIGANSSLPNVHRFYDSPFDPDQYSQHLDADAAESSTAPPHSAGRPSPPLPSQADGFAAPPTIPAPSKAPSADEALQYVNQYILPTVSLPHPQTGKAADAIYLGSAGPSANRYHSNNSSSNNSSSNSSNSAAQAPGFILDDASYRFVGVGGEPALVGSVGASARAATLSAAAASSASRTQAGGYVGVGQGPGTVDAWTAVHRLASARGSGGWGERGAAVPELGWSGRGFGSVAEVERAVVESRRETEGLEKRLVGLVRRNRRLAGLEKGGGGGVAAH